MKPTKHGFGGEGAGLKRGNAVDSDLSLFDVLVATAIAIFAAVWIIAFAGFWIWGALT